ncbi:MAG: hypothetical protein ACI8RY_000767 [Urechidicola sp.]|jgi:hypothetical protein
MKIQLLYLFHNREEENYFWIRLNVLIVILFPDFTGDEFRNIETYEENQYKDKGRFDETNDSIDLGTFKLPDLRNVTKFTLHA